MSELLVTHKMTPKDVSFLIEALSKYTKDKSAFEDLLHGLKVEMFSV